MQVSVPPTVTVKDTGTEIATRRAVNFIDGTGIAVAVADDAANNTVNITIATTGGSSSAVPLTIATGDTFTVSANTQVPYAIPITNNGTIVNMGQLVMLRSA